MKTGIIGLPQVGKTSLFKILTKVDVSSRGHSNPREAHLGIGVTLHRLSNISAWRHEGDVHARCYVDAILMSKLLGSEG